MSKTQESESARGRGSETNYYDVRTWDTQSKGFTFPEQTDSDLKYAPIQGKTDKGICFSGGGTVSVALIAGYLDALDELGLIDKIGYISGVSGGTWGTAPYMFYPGDDDKKLLGAHALPDALTPTFLGETTPGSLAAMCCEAAIADLTLKYFERYGLFTPHSAYEDAVGQIFLQPAGIDSPTERYMGNQEGEQVETKDGWSKLQPHRSFFSSDQAAVDKVVARNENNGITTDDFVTLKEGRPYYIMNTTMLIPESLFSIHPQIYPFEFTPLYAGMKPVQKGKHIHGDKQQIGGAYVESFGFNSEALSSTGNDQYRTTNKYRLELCQPVGTSGSALSQMLDLPIVKAAEKLLPRFSYWNPQNGDSPKTFRYAFGDGGIIENTGIIPLLTRKVTNIVSFVSQMTYYFKNGDTSAQIDTSLDGWEQLTFGYNEIAMLFGGLLIDNKAVKHEAKKQKKAVVNAVWAKDKMDRKVFNDDDSHAHLNYVIELFSNAEASGGPVSANLVLEVLENKLFGTQAYTANVKFTMLGNCSQWTNALQSDVKDMIGKGELSNWPNVKTFKQNKGHIIQLTPTQANMLGNLAYWAVKTESETYTSLLSGNGFPQE